MLIKVFLIYVDVKVFLSYLGIDWGVYLFVLLKCDCLVIISCY